MAVLLSIPRTKLSRTNCMPTEPVIPGHTDERFRAPALSKKAVASGKCARPEQLCLPAFRDRPFISTNTASNKVARWVLRVLARTEARDLYFMRKRARPSIDELLGIDDTHPKSFAAF